MFGLHLSRHFRLPLSRFVCIHLFSKLFVLGAVGSPWSRVFFYLHPFFITVLVLFFDRTFSLAFGSKCLSLSFCSHFSQVSLVGMAVFLLLLEGCVQASCLLGCLPIVMVHFFIQLSSCRTSFPFPCFSHFAGPVTRAL